MVPAYSRVQLGAIAPSFTRSVKFLHCQHLSPRLYVLKSVLAGTRHPAVSPCSARVYETPFGRPCIAFRTLWSAFPLVIPRLSYHSRSPPSFPRLFHLLGGRALFGSIPWADLVRVRSATADFLGTPFHALPRSRADSYATSRAAAPLTPAIAPVPVLYRFR